jgi:hypothetical protein
MADFDNDRNQAEDRLNEIFEPDILLPIQYFASLKRKKYRCGEHRLLVAIMQDAVECFQKHIHARDSKRRQLYVDAEVWICAEEDEGPFSFNNICELLGMNPEYLRTGLLDWRDRERARRRGRLVHSMLGRPVHGEYAESTGIGEMTGARPPQLSLLAPDL